MLLYVLLAFSTLCLGMAISVYAFGTGGKRKKIFQDIYFSVEEVDGMGVLYTKTGEYSAVLRFENPVQKAFMMKMAISTSFSLRVTSAISKAVSILMPPPILPSHRKTKRAG